LFFQRFFAEMISDCISLHEPDYLNFDQYRGLGEKAVQMARQVGEVGLLILLQKIFHGGLVELSDARVRGQITYEEAVRKLLAQRWKFVECQRGALYVESSSAYYGLIDVLKDVYESHRIAYIIRDGRFWVQSKMNFGRMYNKCRVRTLVSHAWPTALEFIDDPYRIKWDAMTRFEKICWAWSRLNAYAIASIENNPNARLYYFEDIFESQNGADRLAEMVEFLTSFVEAGNICHGFVDEWVNKKVHGSSKTFGSWQNWTREDKESFKEICGPVMDRAGYSYS